LGDAAVREGLRSSYIAVIGGLVLVLAVAAASVALAVHNARALEVASRTQDIRASVTRLVEDMTDAETGQRGYLLTGKPLYLAPYERGSDDAPKVLGALSAALDDDPEVAPIIARLGQLVGTKLGELAETVEATKAGRHDRAMDMVMSDRGQRDMEEIRKLTGEIAARQQRQLTAYLAAVEWGGRLIVGIAVLGLALLLALGIAILVGTRRAMRVLRAAQDDLALANTALEGINERLEQKVAQRTADLTAANDEIQRFAYIVSHDLRAPLVNIMGFTGELETATRIIADYVTKRAAEDQVPAPDNVTTAAQEDLPEAIRFIKASSGKMDRLIAAILKLSREGRRVLNPEPIEMAPFLRGIADSLQHQCAERGAEILIGQVPDLRADRVTIEQIFSNLMENAVKYLDDSRPGRIVVSGRSRGGMVEFDVQDNGRGIAARDHERVFELFRRAGDQRVPGEGIGLAHVRALVRRLGGTIGCTSAENVGSTFRVTIPAAGPRMGESG
jgi:signal transduction histidine kinase